MALESDLLPKSNLQYNPNINFAMSSRIPLVFVRPMGPLPCYSTDPNGAKGTGTFGLPGPESNGARIHTMEEARSLVYYYLDHGYNTIDTARLYGGGTSEEVGRLRVSPFVNSSPLCSFWARWTLETTSLSIQSRFPHLSAVSWAHLACSLQSISRSARQSL